MSNEEELIKTILESHEYLDKSSIKIKDIRFSTCFGCLPKKYQKGKKTHGEWRTCEVDIQFSDSYIHRFTTFEDLFDKLDRLTDWEFSGFAVPEKKKDDKETETIIRFDFANYQNVRMEND